MYTHPVSSRGLSQVCADLKWHRHVQPWQTAKELVYDRLMNPMSHGESTPTADKKPDMPRRLAQNWRVPQSSERLMEDPANSKILQRQPRAQTQMRAVLGLRCTTWRLSLVGRRPFSYEDTLAFRLHGPKPQAVVIHPVLTAGAAGWGKPWQQILWDAEEALGLARANRWDLLPGPNGEPAGGWDHEAFAAAEAEDLLRRQASGAWSAPEGWHLDRGEEESDDEYDIHEAAWKNGKVKRQWAETCIQKVRQIDPNTFFGKGKVTELALYLAENPCSYVFINTTLTPNQTRNLETVFNNAVAAGDANERREQGLAVPKGGSKASVEVIDRNRLVLEIFSLRARTPQAKVQVGLARLEYLKTRLTLGTKARLRETIKLLHEQVGPFKEVTGFKSDVEIQYHYEATPFETERTLLRIAQARMKKCLETEKRSRKLQRINREGVPTIGIVGYTNAGKTSLMNRLTDAGLRERDLLFQTLDTTMRRVKLPSGGHAIIADSIGFIQHLPHNLFAAFQTTLDEIVSCDVLLHVRDIAHPQRTMQKDIVLKTLRSAGMPESKLRSSVIEVWNKIDLLSSMSYVPPEAVPICAADGTGVEDLLHVLDAVIGAQLDKQRRTVKFPQELMPQVMAFLHKNGAVDQESLSIEEDGDSTTAKVCIDAVLPAVGWKRWEAEWRNLQQLDLDTAHVKTAGYPVYLDALSLAGESVQAPVQSGYGSRLQAEKLTTWRHSARWLRDTGASPMMFSAAVVLIGFVSCISEENRWEVMPPDHQSLQHLTFLEVLHAEQGLERGVEPRTDTTLRRMPSLANLPVQGPRIVLQALMSFELPDALTSKYEDDETLGIAAPLASLSCKADNQNVAVEVLKDGNDWATLATCQSAECKALVNFKWNVGTPSTSMRLIIWTTRRPITWSTMASQTANTASSQPYFIEMSLAGRDDGGKWWGKIREDTEGELC
ncbi:hflX [Symbiodinium sp. KB8]|nr:hflX [Symbiodinium sp. KB8]